MAKASNKGASAPATKQAKVATNKAPEATTAPATAVEAEAAPAKAKRPAAVVQNGVQRPRAGGLCAAVWEITENLSEAGQLPSIAQVKAKALESGLNPTNVSIEYYRCRQFHGVRGRQAIAKPAEAEAQQ